MIIYQSGLRSSRVRLKCLLEWCLVDDDGAGRVAACNTGRFLHIEHLPAAYPIQGFLQQAHRKMADDFVSFSTPAQRATFDMPEYPVIVFLDPHFLVCILVEQLRKSSRTVMQLGG